MNPFRYARLAFIALLMTFLLSLSGTSQATFPGANGRILLSTWRDGVYRVITINPDGTDKHVLWDEVSPGFRSASWSPDGTTIAFTATSETGVDLFTMDADGTNIAQVTSLDGFVSAVDWAPDGSRLSFLLGGRRARLYVVDPGGTDMQKISSKRVVFGYDWAPTSDRLVFASSADGQWQLFTDAIAGGDAEQITTTNGNAMAPEWSPDGDRIAYGTVTRKGHTIMTVKPDGTNGGAVMPGYFPTWSPDGTSIATNDARGTIRTASPDGADVTVIPDSEYLRGPIFSPDSSSLVATSLTHSLRSSGRTTIWVLSADGSERHKLLPTFSAAHRDVFGIDWQPI